MYRLIAFLVARRWRAVTFAATVVAVTALVAGVPGVDNSLEVWFVEDDPALAAYRTFLDTFGNDEVVLTVVENGDGDAFTAEHLGRIGRLTRSLEAIDGVASVQSLASVTVPGAGRLIDGTGSVDVARVRRVAEASPQASRLVTEDGRSFILTTWMDAAGDIDAERPRILEALRAATDEALAGSGMTATHAGMGVMYDALNRATFDEGATFIGLSYLAIAIALYVVTRRMVWTVLAMVCISAADVTLFGVMAMTGASLNAITMALPALVMILGVSHIVHMGTALGEDPGAGSAKPGVMTGLLAAVAVPCFFNTLTTASGFASLGTANMAITRSYGLFAALGVVLAFGFSLVGVVAVAPRVHRRTKGNSDSRLLADIVEAVVAGSARRPGLVGLLTLCVVIAAGLGATRIVVDTYSIDFLPKDDAYRRDSERVEHVVGAYVPVELEIEVPHATSWQDAAFLNRLAAAQMDAEAVEETGRSTSAIDVLKETAWGVSGVRPAEGWAPGSEAEVQGLMTALDRTGNGDALAPWISADDRTVRMTVPIPMRSAGTMVARAEEIRRVVADATGTTVSLSGYLPLYGRLIDSLVTDQVASFSLAFVSVFLLVLLILRSWRLALAAIAPNLLPVGVILGVMGWSGIRLDIATVTIAAAVLGVVVDDTIHILYRFRIELAKGLAVGDALSEVARTSGRAVVATSLILCVGFGVMAACGVRSVSYVGLLTGVGVLSALVTDLVLLPASITVLYRDVPMRSEIRSAVHPARSAAPAA